MAKCDHCGTIIIAGGVRLEGRRYCGQVCYEAGYVGEIAATFSAEEIEEHALAIYEGDCPVCGRAGAVDVYTAHYVWSALVLTQHWSESRICCRSCGRSRQMKAALLSAGLGLWGVPWGVIFTPIQVGRNLAGILQSPGDGPSAALRQTSSLLLA